MNEGRGEVDREARRKAVRGAKQVGLGQRRKETDREAVRGRKEGMKEGRNVGR